jgi:hypothetical protein
MALSPIDSLTSVFSSHFINNYDLFTNVRELKMAGGGFGRYMARQIKPDTHHSAADYLALSFPFVFERRGFQTIFYLLLLISDQIWRTIASRPSVPTSVAVSSGSISDRFRVKPRTGGHSISAAERRYMVKATSPLDSSTPI